MNVMRRVGMKRNVGDGERKQDKEKLKLPREREGGLEKIGGENQDELEEQRKA